MSAWRRLMQIITAWAWLLPFCSVALAADPFIRATVNTQGSIRIGQQVEIDIDVYVPNFFMSSPQFPLLDLPNAVVTLSDAADNLNETVEGASFAGIRRTYLVTPQAGGNYTLPPADITFSYAAVPGQAFPGKLTLPPTSFTVEGAAPGAASSATPTIARVSMTQTLDPDTREMAVGGTLVRTVEVDANGMQAMMIPEPEFPAPNGVRIYRHDPKLVDEESPRGDFIGGSRTDTVTYLFDQAGSYTLPAIELAWTDPKSGTTETASAPAIDIVVKPAAAAETAIAPPTPEEKPVVAASRIDWKKWAAVTLACVIALAALLWLLLSVLPRVKSAMTARRIERRNSEPAMFQRFQTACRGSDRLAAYKRLDAWARSCGIGSVTEWMERYGNVDARRAYAGFEQAIFGGAEASSSNLAALRNSMANARQAWLANRHQQSQDAQALPPLNPDWVA